MQKGGTLVFQMKQIEPHRLKTVQLSLSPTARQQAWVPKKHSSSWSDLYSEIQIPPEPPLGSPQTELNTPHVASALITQVPSLLLVSFAGCFLRGGVLEHRPWRWRGGGTPAGCITVGLSPLLVHNTLFWALSASETLRFTHWDSHPLYLVWNSQCLPAFTDLFQITINQIHFFPSIKQIFFLINTTPSGDFSGGPAAKNPRCRGPGFHPWSGN